MIIVVEGISAAGKSTWCRRYETQVVPELGGLTPLSDDPVAQARFWVEAHSRRWATAVQVEEQHRQAFCDTDPLKLHYTWCLWRIGQASQNDWLTAVAMHREAIARQRLGFADVVVFLEPDTSVVRQQKELDQTRSRRNFDLHLKLATPLREWYEMIETVGGGRVIWHGERTTDIPMSTARADRYSVARFDEIVDRATLA